jgi:hypothetical protein
VSVLWEWGSGPHWQSMSSTGALGHHHRPRVSDQEITVSRASGVPTIVEVFHEFNVITRHTGPAFYHT